MVRARRKPVTRARLVSRRASSLRHRDGRAERRETILDAALAEFSARGFAAALARGVAADQMSPKAYWGRGKANENNGEPGDRAEV